VTHRSFPGEERVPERSRRATRHRAAFLIVVLLLAASVPVEVLAHPGRSLAPGGVWRAWVLDPWVLLGIGIPTWLYARGTGNLWRRAGRGRGIPVWRFGAYCAGFLSLVVALLSPLHALGGALFAAHMAQHEILILVSAPLLIAGHPQVAFAWALPAGWIRFLHRMLGATPIRYGWRAMSHPIGAWTIHALALWIWHLPSLYQATLRSEAAHAGQHLSFFITALLFWWTLLRRPPDAAGQGLGVLLLFTTAMYSGVLGALLTFAGSAWYPMYEESAARWGVTALVDQQVGGFIMWVPGGIIYLGAAVYLLARWIRLADRRTARGAISEAGAERIRSRAPSEAVGGGPSAEPEQVCP